MKIMIYWLEKGCRKPKMRGLATATGSTFAIQDYSSMARNGKGTLFIVQAENATIGRDLITAYRKENPKHNSIVTIGDLAAQAIDGAKYQAATHNTNLHSQGRVYQHQTRAIKLNEK